jgi:YihY family inner membrane protein
MSVAQTVPETWELTGDDAKEALRATGQRRLAADAFVRLRASDGFSHARSLAFVTTLLLVQGVIVIVGLAGAVGQNAFSATIVRALREVAPGPAGRMLTDAVHRAYHAGLSGRYLALVLGGVAALITGSTLMGQFERALNRLYGIEQDRPTTRKYSRALVLTLTAGALAVAAFAMFALGHSIGVALDDDTMRSTWKVLRWPLALVLVTAAVAMLFRHAPHRRQPTWSWLTLGASVAVVLWSLVTLALGFVFELSNSFGETYGPLTGMIALLLWALLSSIAILFGAAVAAQLEAVRAGAPGPRDEAKAKVGATRAARIRVTPPVTAARGAGLRGSARTR